MQYPKMLYKGDQEKYTYEIAQHEAHEDELREAIRNIIEEIEVGE